MSTLPLILVCLSAHWSLLEQQAALTKSWTDAGAQAAPFLKLQFIFILLKRALKPVGTQVEKIPLFGTPISFVGCPCGALELGQSTGLSHGTWVSEYFHSATSGSGPVAPWWMCG